MQISSTVAKFWHLFRDHSEQKHERVAAAAEVAAPLLFRTLSRPVTFPVTAVAFGSGFVAGACLAPASGAEVRQRVSDEGRRLLQLAGEGRLREIPDAVAVAYRRILSTAPYSVADESEPLDDGEVRGAGETQNDLGNPSAVSSREAAFGRRRCPRRAAGCGTHIER